MDPVAGPAADRSLAPGARRAASPPAGAPPTEMIRLRQTAQDFEAIFLTHLLKTLRDSLPKGGVFPSGTAMKTYQSFMDDELGKALSKGGGIGLADVLVRDLTRRLSGPENPSSRGASLPIDAAEGPIGTSNTAGAPGAAASGNTAGAPGAAASGGGPR